MNNYSSKPATLLHAILTLFLALCLSAFLATNFTAANALAELPPDQKEFSLSEQPLTHEIAEKDEIMVNNDGALDDAEIYTEIREVADFGKVRENPAGFFRLVADIEMDSTVSWIPLGNSSAAFTGKFDGQGHTISGLYIQAGTNYIGLFGHTNGATLENIRLEGVNITGGSHVGGLVGRADQTTFVNCAVTGTMKGTGNYVGGLAGFVDGATLENIRLEGVIITGGGYVGGLVGRAVHTTFVNCAVTGAMTGTGNYVGGLAGHATEKSTVFNTYANCDVSGNTGIGGLVGFLYNSSEIYNSYSAGTISGLDTVGGLVGQATLQSAISNCYSRAEVRGGDLRVGGLVGLISREPTCINSYWDLETSGQSQSALGEGRTTAAMQTRANYENWDFETIWSIREGQFYPVLQWQLENADEDNEPIDEPPGFPPFFTPQYHEMPGKALSGFSKVLAARFQQLKKLLADAEMIIDKLQAGPGDITETDITELREIYDRAELLFILCGDYLSEEERNIISGGLEEVLKAIDILEEII
jgi:hypothetical protein